MDDVARLLVYLKDDYLGELCRDAMLYQVSSAGTFRAAELETLRAVMPSLPKTVKESEYVIRAALKRFPLLRSQRKEEVLNKLQILAQVWQYQLGTVLELQKLDEIANTLRRYKVEELRAMVRKPIPAAQQPLTKDDLKAMLAEVMMEMKHGKKEEDEHEEEST
jgi:hypothetical protein